MRLAVAVIVATALWVPSLAAAQPGLTNPQYRDEEVPAQRGPVQPTATYGYERPLPPPLLPDAKSEGTATALAIGGSLAGYALIGAGANSRHGGTLAAAGMLTILIGPSAGHIYAGETGHAVKMSLLRTGGVAAMVAGLVMSLAPVAHHEPCYEVCNDQPSRDSHAGTGLLLLLAGGVTFVVSTVYDVVDASAAVRRHNNKLLQRSFMVTPMYAQTANGGSAPGVALSGRF